MKINDNASIEMKKSFEFFINEASEYNESFGLVRDRYPSAKNVSSIASTGFGLASLVIGVERGYIPFSHAQIRAEKTLKTLTTLEQFKGLFRHFYHLKTATALNCEYSTIDTAILLCGAITASNFFGGEVAKICKELVQRVQWSSFIDENFIFNMAYDVERGFFSKWNGYAEQLMIYLLAIMSKNYKVDKRAYYAFSRNVGAYKGKPFIYTESGSLFTYQYSHAFIDFNGFVDENGVDWFINSVNATKASRRFCIDESKKYVTYSKNSWGLTACDTPWGYMGNVGSRPCGENVSPVSVGVIAPCGAIGSFPFLPKECSDALNYYYSLNSLKTVYGLCDAFSFDHNYVSRDVVAIDKGISLIMLDNFYYGTVWRYFNDADVLRAKTELGIKKSKR